MNRKYVLGFFGLTVGIIFLYFSLREVEFTRLKVSLVNAKFAYFIPYGVLTLLFFWLKSLRWRILLKNAKVFKSLDLIGPIMIGFGCNNIFPLRVGELIRIHVFAKWSGLSNYTVLSSIALERLFDILGLCFLGVFLSVIGDNNIVKFRIELFVFTSVVIATLFFFIYAVKAEDKAKALLGKVLFFLPENWTAYLSTKLGYLINGLASLRNIRPIIFSLNNSIFQWVLLVGCIMLSAKSLSVEIPISAAILTLLVTAVGVALPSAPAFVGTIELAFVVVLGWYQIPSEKAFAMAVIYHILNFTIVTSLGIYFAYRMGFHRKHAMSTIADATRHDRT